VSINSVPCNRREGSKPALSDSDVDDLAAFLQTLTDAAHVRKRAESGKK
jgi:cytochrome c